MRVEEVLEGPCPKQGTPKAKSVLGCTLFELFNQIAYSRDPRSFAVFQIPDQRHDTPGLQDPGKLGCRGIIILTPVKGLKSGEVFAVSMVR